MTAPTPNAFHHLPRTADAHFRLCFYAAVYRLIHHLRRLARAEDELERTFERYPFLAGYFEELRPYLPDEAGWDDVPRWWEAEITAWERSGGGHLPLLALAEHAGIDFSSRTALMIVGLVEEDSRFGTLFAGLQEPLAHRRPCLELVRQILADGASGTGDVWGLFRPLFTAGVIDAVNREAPRSEWVLRVPPVLWDAARGERDPRPAPWCTYHRPEEFASIDALILADDLKKRLAQVPSLVRDGTAGAIVLRGTPGSERLATVGAVARALGRGVIAVEGTMPAGEPGWAALGPLCAMLEALPVVTWDLAPGETAEVPELTGYRGPLGVLIGREGGVSGRMVQRAVTFSLPSLRVDQRRACWEASFAAHPVDDVRAIAERFQLPGGYIRQVASLAIAHAGLAGRDTVRIGDVREACGALNRQHLDNLALRLEVDGTWERLVVSDAARYKLRELELRCRNRERLMHHLGAGFASSGNQGVRALFTGPSGTGKTLAAQVLAAQLEMDLYRVDLAAVINKYIGETEKNLHRILSRAEELDVILLIDEGDALLGTRTQVKSANDRYANLETNYLLQRLEHYQGIVVVTTNAAEHIDSAFQRRMDVVVNFLNPQLEQRWQIWQLHLPSDHVIEPGYLEEVAARCALTGGQIRNTALHASLLATGVGGVVNRWHLEEAIYNEYRKAGATCPLSPVGRGSEARGGMEAFLGVLSS